MTLGLDLDLDVDAGGEVELLELIDRLGSGLDDVEEALVGAHLELVHALFIDVRGTVDGETLDLGRERDRPGDDGTGARRGLGDLGRGTVEQTVIKRLEADADAGFGHKFIYPSSVR